MKKSLIKYFIGLLPLLAFISCSEEIEEINNALYPDGVTVNISLPEDIVAFLSRANEDADRSDISIKNLFIAQYNGNNLIGEIEEITDNSGITLDENGNYSFSFIFDTQTTTAEFIANLTDTNLDISALSSPTNKKRAWEIATSNRTLWGSASINPSGKSVNVNLIRNFAKLNVESDAEGFEILDFNLYGQNENATIAPNASTTYSEGLTLPESPSYKSKTTTQNGLDDEETLYMFETPSSQEMFVILHAKFNNSEYYYKAAFASRSYKGNTDQTPANDEFPDEIVGNYSYSYLPVKRNHRYILKIDYVRAEGFGSITEAIASKPDNRLTAEIVDVNTEILDIIACRDYALGVSSSNINVKGEATSCTFDIVHNFKKNDGSYPVPDVTKTEGNWITAFSVGTGSACTNIMEGTVNNDGSTQLKGNTGMKYTVTLTFPQNTDDENYRTATFLIKVGDLSRKITIKQEERDYLRGEDRPVILSLPSSTGVYSTVTTDYFAWIDQRNRETTGEFCYGVREVDNRGVKRTDGLIFPPVNMYNGYSVKYLIKKKTGDSVTAPSGFSSSTESFDGEDYWAITQSSPSTEIGISNFRKLVISNGSTVINYVIYTTGFFHQLTSDMVAIQGGSSVKTGWYYYEFVMKSNTKNTNYTQYILDRNLGAENNNPYISTYIGYHNYSNAVGAYFQVATSRSAALTSEGTTSQYWNFRKQSTGTIITALDINKGTTGKFHIPSKRDLDNFNVILSRPSSGVTGNASYVASIGNLTTSLVKDNKIYIPHAGYYEGSMQKMTTRANIWTGTIYSEPQGYHPNYNTYNNINYGFWYYFLDSQPVSGKTNVFGQMRCNDATQSNFSDAAVYRYMPVRLVWGTPDDRNEESKNSQYDDDENYFHNGNTVSITWGNNYDNGKYWYRYIYVWYTPEGGNKVEPFGGFPGEGNNTDGKQSYTKTITISGNVSSIGIIVCDGSGTDEMKYIITPSSISNEGGKNADGTKAKISGTHPTFNVNLW